MNLRALVLLPLAGIAATAQVREEILVVVNNHIITRRGFQQAVEQATASLYRQFSGKQLDAKLRDAREAVLQGLIDAFLVQDRAADLGIKLSDEDVRPIIDDIKKQNNFASDADFERELKKALNITLAEFIQTRKREMVQHEVLRMEVYRKIAIEDQELRAYYEDHKDEYKQASRFRVRELVISKGTSPEGAQAKLAAVKKALAEGKPFEEVAKQYSESPSKDTGGDLGWMGKGLMRAAIEKAALALTPGQVSEPLETEKDFMLLQLVASEDDKAKPFEEVRQQIMEKVGEPKAENAKANYLGGLRTRANIRYLVPKETILKG